jgi:hypothetical protein
MVKFELFLSISALSSESCAQQQTRQKIFVAKTHSNSIIFYSAINSSTITFSPKLKGNSFCFQTLQVCKQDLLLTVFDALFSYAEKVGGKILG